MKAQSDKVRAFWEAFQASVAYDAAPRFYEAFHFADSEEVADDLLRLVLLGTKRATAALFWSYEVDGEKPPVPGALSVATDWAGTPHCVIETLSVEVIAFDEVPASFAKSEGEGDASLEYWRRVHWEFFGRDCERIGRQPSLLMPVLCEKFEVVYVPHAS